MEKKRATALGLRKMAINFRKTEFIKSAPTFNERPDAFECEYLFVGKSNVGKSSLLNALCDNKNLAKTSSKPGHTTLLNYFSVDNAFYIVDAPGYGYSSRGQQALINFGKMMETYFFENPYLNGVLFLVDSRHIPTSDDIDFYQFLMEQGIPFALILTKCDKLNQKKKAAIKKNLTNAFGDIDVPIILTSALDKSSMKEVQAQIEAWQEENESEETPTFGIN